MHMGPLPAEQSDRKLLKLKLQTYFTARSWYRERIGLKLTVVKN